MRSRRTRNLILLALMAIAIASPQARAEGPEPAFMQKVFTPELVMKNAREIGLREDQRQAITAAIQQTQAAVLELQWAMQDAATELGREMEKDRIDEKAALSAVDKVMAIEAKVKRAHLGLLIRIKNRLDPEQQARLVALRSERG